MSEKISYSVILFLSANHTVKAESILLNNSINCKMIPVPRNISSDCGVCVRIFTKDKKRAIKVLSELKMEIVVTEDL